jgi:hypothetical protein
MRLQGQLPDSYKITLLPDKKWVMQKYSYSMPSANIVGTGELVYEGEYNGFPLLTRATSTAEKNQEPIESEEYVVTRIIPGPVAAKEFTPTALNLQIGHERANWWPRIGVLAVGAGLLVAYFLIKRRNYAT